MSTLRDTASHELTQSNMRVYSLGTVAANKLRGSHVIEVTPIEKLPLLDGEITDHVEELTIDGQSSTGAYSTKVKTSATIQATWYPGENTNRRNAPDVRRGEIVNILQFADDMTQFYWTTLTDSFHLRRLETSTVALSGDPDNPPSEDLSNCYVFESSTHDGLVRLRTSQANGEPYAYDVEINTKAGTVTITDNANNYIHINSNQDLIDLTNGRGTFLRLNADDMEINVVNNLSINVGGKTSVNVADSIDTESGSTITSSAASSVTNKAPTIVEDGGNINLTGNVSSSGGSFGGTGKMDMGGDVTMQNLDVTGNANVSSVLHANKVISDQPIDAPNV